MQFCNKGSCSLLTSKLNATFIPKCVMQIFIERLLAPIASLLPDLATLSYTRNCFFNRFKISKNNSVLMVSASLSGSTFPSTWTTSSFKTSHYMCNRIGLTNIALKIDYPDPSPLDAPATSPAISTNSITVGITF